MSSLTQKWLRQSLGPYAYKDLVYSDVDSTLARFTTLRPKSDVYTYDDGRTQLLLCLHGLLPISYRNSSYNIPVAIWLTRDFPRHPPIAYVVPTGDMLVKAGKYVDVSGKCDIEYVQNWARKSEGCNLSSLLDAMQDQFSREPPVYAKSSDNAPATPPSRHQGSFRGYGDRPPPPLPTHPPTSYSPPSEPPNLNRPIVPPKPGSSTASVTPDVRAFHPPPSLESNIVVPQPPPPQYGGSNISPPPILPLYPVPASTPTAAHRVTPFPAGNDNPIPNSRWSPLPPLNPPPIPPPHLPYSSPPPLGHVPPPPPPPPHVPTPNLLDEDSPETQAHDQQPSPAPPPPRPPNPELLQLHAQVFQKLTTELGSLSEALAHDAERLRAHQADLLSGEPAIRDEMGRLEAVRDVCHNVAGRMRSVVTQAESNISELRRKGDPEVDELICSTTIVYNQLITLVAEDNAIEDTIFHLHRALNAGRIDLERFLRSTRLWQRNNS